MSHPPLAPPPFVAPEIRKCIKANVRIQNHEPVEEVLILTTVLCSVESQLNPSPNRSLNAHHVEDSEDEDRGYTSSIDEDMSDFSESTSDEEESDDTDEGDHISSRNAQNGDARQSRGGNEDRYRMKAFWLKKLICEVRALSCLI